MPESTDNLSGELFALLGDAHETAAVTLFLQLLRESPSLRHWLRTAYFHPETRRRFDACLDGKTSIPQYAHTGRQILGWLADTDGPRLREISRHQTRDVEVCLHGGLTRAQVIQLIRRYQAGLIDLAPFLLALAWRNAPAKVSSHAALYLMSGKFLEKCFFENRADMIRQLAMAIEQFRERPVGQITRARFGYGRWWRMSVLHYMLNHPKPRYRTGEFMRHLIAQKITVDPKDLRRFCDKHGIARDTRPGRPAKIKEEI